MLKYVQYPITVSAVSDYSILLYPIAVCCRIRLQYVAVSDYSMLSYPIAVCCSIRLQYLQYPITVSAVSDYSICSIRLQYIAVSYCSMLSYPIAVRCSIRLQNVAVSNCSMLHCPIIVCCSIRMFLIGIKYKGNVFWCIFIYNYKWNTENSCVCVRGGGGGVEIHSYLHSLAYTTIKNKFWWTYESDPFLTPPITTHIGVGHLIVNSHLLTVTC